MSAHRALAGVLAGVVAAAGAGWVAGVRLVAVALAADPTATPGSGGDPRVPDGSPGFVGEPLLAVAVVLGVGAIAVVATLAYVRLTARPRG